MNEANNKVLPKAGSYIMLAAGKYIIRQRRISYCASDISLKSAAKRDIICSINKNLKELI